MRLDLAWRSKETNQVGINEFARLGQGGRHRDDAGGQPRLARPRTPPATSPNTSTTPAAPPGATCAAATASRSPTDVQHVVPRQRDGRPLADRPQGRARVRPPRQRDRQGDEAVRHERRDHRLRQLQRRDADLSRMGAAGARGVLRERRLHLAAQVFRQLQPRHAELFRQDRGDRPLHPGDRRRHRLRQGEEAGEERRLHLLRRVERLVPQPRGGLEGAGAPGTGPRRRRCSRRTTTSRTRCSSAGCSTSSSAAATG